MNSLRSLLAGVAGLSLPLVASAMAPEAWVKKWETFTAPQSGFVLLVETRPELSSILAELPPPAEWPVLVERLKAAEEGAIGRRRLRFRLARWMIEELSGRGAQVVAEIEAAKAAKELDGNLAGELLQALGRGADASPEARVKAFETEIARYREARGPAFGDYIPRVETPDLVTLVGEEKAAALLRDALTVRVTLRFESAAEATEALARRLATDGVAALTAPQWRLAASLDGVALYEALSRRFGPPKEDDYEFREARAYYIIGLILADRPDDALREATAAGEEFRIPHDLGERLGRGGNEGRVHAFLHAYLSTHPEAADSLWTDYRRLAVSLGKHEQMLDLIRVQAANPALVGGGGVQARRRLALAELAADDVAAGLPRLRAVLSEARKLDGQAKPALELAGELFAVARALNERQAEDEAVIALVELGRASLADAGESYSFGLSAKEALQQLAKAGREADALSLATALEAAHAERAKGKSDDYNAHFAADALAGVLEIRLGLAVAGKRWEEAGKLLEQTPGWNVADAIERIRDEDTEKDEIPFGVLVARVLAARGDVAGARRALEAQLARTAGSDAAHADYVALLGPDAAPLLDTLYSLDPYEERPLIWKAVLAARAGDHAGAERLARAAIAVDPSDGEQGRGDRMRVYTVLGEARAAQGDATEAEFFGRVVRAIRLSEEADGWHAAGLFSRSIAGYRQALELFADAYCVQSRLAIRLMEQGRMEEAMVHYQKAYELMPGSFGRVESHCFGCESAFDGERQQSVAERVFSRMAAEDPKKPQVPYLLGYLREEQGRLVEAAELYRRAVELDPLYLNAWKKLDGLGERMAMSRAERDKVALQLLHLDPLARHFYPDFDEIGDATVLWHALTEARARAQVLPQPASVLPMPASAAQTKPAPYSARFSRAAKLYPARILAERTFTREAAQAAEMLRMRR